MRAIGDEKIRPIDGDALLLQTVEFRGNRHGIDDDAVADHANLAGAENAGGDQVQDVLRPVHDHRMAGIVAALAAHDDIRLLG